MNTIGKRIWSVRIGLWLAVVGTLAAAETVEEALRRGVLAEEVQRNLPAAQRAYEDAVRIAESQREAAAAALYRLAEVQRLQGATREARTALERLVRQYPEATNLVAVARRQLGVLEPDATGAGRSPASQRERIELELQLQELDMTLARLTALRGRDLVDRLVVEFPNDLLVRLANDSTAVERDRAALGGEFGPQHPKRLEVERRAEVIDKQLGDACQVVLASLGEKRDRLKKKWELLGSVDAGGSPAGISDDLLQQEIALAEEQVKIAERRLAAGNGSSEEVIKAKREVLSLKRQRLSRPTVSEVSAPGVTADPPPQEAVVSEELARLRRLAAESPDLLSRGSDGETPLQRAAARGWKPVVEYLLDLGVPADNVTRSDLGTALHRAARAGNLEIATLLLGRGADVNVRGNRNETPLHCAVRSGHRAMAELLIQKGASLDPQTDRRVGIGYSGWESDVMGNTPLHLAAFYGASSLLDLLLQRGASLSATNFSGQTPLIVAQAGRQADCFRRLLAAGSPVDTLAQRVRPDGADNPWFWITPVQMAARLQDTNALQLLLKAGASPHLTGPDGRTPLHCAAEAGGNGMDLLLIAGAEVNARDVDGMTPLDRAAGASGDWQAWLRAKGGTNAVSKRGPEIPTPSRALAPGVVVARPAPAVPAQARPTVTVYGQVFRQVPFDDTNPVRLRDVVRIASPPANTDLSRVEVRREDRQTGSLVIHAVDLTSPDQDFELQVFDQVYLRARPRPQ